MLRKSRELRYYCECCSIDPPTSVYGGGKSKSRERQMVKRRAKRREERRWLREFREDSG